MLRAADNARRAFCLPEGRCNPEGCRNVPSVAQREIGQLGDTIKVKAIEGELNRNPLDNEVS
jgi:hypothetical protein